MSDGIRMEFIVVIAAISILGGVAMGLVSTANEAEDKFQAECLELLDYAEEDGYTFVIDGHEVDELPTIEQMHNYNHAVNHAKKEIYLTTRPRGNSGTVGVPVVVPVIH